MYIGEALGRPKDPVAASGRLKILYDYILNNSKILLDTIWISYSNCDKQKILEKVFFLNTRPELSPTLVVVCHIQGPTVGNTDS